jgi:1-acyl-sn-glycerol-3-phosphate acyltransferase
MLLQAQRQTPGRWTSSWPRREGESRSEQALYWLGRSVVALCARTMLRMDMQWRALLPSGPKILAANHPTTTDPFLILTLLPEQISVLVTGGAFEIPGFGAYLRRAGHIPVIRDSGGATVRAAQAHLEAGRTMAIFPEGALSPLAGGLGFHRPHSGVARLALATGAPVIPVGIGLDPIKIRFVDVEVGVTSEEGRFYTGGPCAITVGGPMSFKGDVEDWDYVRLVSGRIMDRIAHLSRDSAGRIKPSPAVMPAPRMGHVGLSSADMD